jgi:tetratricopeptide (TPR) repeat protein
MMKSHSNRFFLTLVLSLAAVIVQGQDRKKSQEYYIKGQTQFNSARYEKAIEFYTLAIEADSTNYNAWIRRGFTRGMVKDFTGEMEDYSSVIQKDPDHIWAYISRGSAMNRKSMFNEAIVDFNRALEINPKEPEAYNNRGFAKKGLGDKEGACEDWQMSKKLGNEEAKIILKNNYCK